MALATSRDEDECALLSNAAALSALSAAAVKEFRSEDMPESISEASFFSWSAEETERDAMERLDAMRLRFRRSDTVGRETGVDFSDRQVPGGGTGPGREGGLRSSKYHLGRTIPNELGQSEVLGTRVPSFRFAVSLVVSGGRVGSQRSLFAVAPFLA